MEFVSAAFPARLERIVLAGNHHPVIGTDDALVVIGELLAAQFEEQAGLLVPEGEPSFFQDDGAAALGTPDADMLGRKHELQVLVLVVELEHGAAHDENGHSVVFLVRQAALSQLSACPVRSVNRELVVFLRRSQGVRLSGGGQDEEQRQGQEEELFHGRSIGCFLQIYKNIMKTPISPRPKGWSTICDARPIRFRCRPARRPSAPSAPAGGRTGRPSRR